MNYRFALAPRFLVGHVAVVLAVVVMVNLALWQFRRLDERRQLNARMAARLEAPIVPLESVIGRDIDEIEFLRVRVTGSYSTDADLLLTYRSLQGLSGHHVVTPLVAREGPVVLVERGWVGAEALERWPLPNGAAPAGAVEIVGVVRASQPGGTFVDRSEGSSKPATMSRIDVNRAGRQLDRTLVPFWLRLQSPGEPDGVPALLPPPDLSEGPHRSYAFQWLAFSVMTLGGWMILLRVSARRRALARRGGDRENDAATPLNV